MWRQTARNGLDYLQQIQNKENVVNLATFDNDAFQGSIGQFDSNNLWYISESDGVSIHQNFEYLYRNRLHNRRQKIRQVDLVDQEEPSFKPNVLKQSRKLAEKYRERVLEETALLIENQLLDVKVPENGLITHADLLMMQSRSQEIFRQRKKNELEEIQVRECSFRPQILDYKSQKQDVYNQEVAYRPQQYKPSQRYLQLYQLAKPSKQRQDKTNLQIDYEKHCDECTFTPDISQSQKQNLSKKLIYAKNVDSTIERMRKANEQRKIDDYWKHGRGYQVPKKNQNKHKSFVRQEQKNIFQQINDSNESEVEYKPHNQIHQRQSTEQDERIPLLFVDVNLGNGVQERIVVYEGDQSQNLAQQFVIQHNLDPSMISRLKENLDIQISSLLHRIDEENQQELTEENSQLY